MTVVSRRCDAGTPGLVATVVAAAAGDGAGGTPRRNCVCTGARRARPEGKQRRRRLRPRPACRRSFVSPVARSRRRRRLGRGRVGDVSGDGLRKRTRPTVACTRGRPWRFAAAVRRRPQRSRGRTGCNSRRRRRHRKRTRLTAFCSRWHAATAACR